MRPNKQEFSLRSRFRHAVKRCQIADGSSLVVGVSGGCDSVSLLDLLREEAPQRQWSLHAGHLDHALRPESADDAAFVRGLCKKMGLPSHGLRVHPDVWDRARGQSVEAVARSLRRKALQRIAMRVGADYILLGHTRDDQAETVLLRLLRGSGVRGLGAMRARRGRWIRPLLDVGRAELRARAERHGLQWLEDPWNEDPRFDRVRVRHQILPRIEAAFGPGTSRILSRTARALHSVSDYIDLSVEEAWVELAPQTAPGSIRLERASLAIYHPALVEGILRRAFRAVGAPENQMGLAHIRALERAVRETAPRSFDLPGNVRATVNARDVRLVKGIEES